MNVSKKNTSALIIGGSSGLGLATAKKLAENGYDIIIIHRDRKAAMDTIEKEFGKIKANQVRVTTYNYDALAKEKRKKILADIQTENSANTKISVLVHSIAKGNLKPMVATDGLALGNDDFQLTINAMAINLFDWVSELYSASLFAADTRVISFTSEGNQRVWENYAAVSAAKATLEALTRNIALEFAPFGIKANCIQAGITETASFRMIPGHEALKQNALKRNPHGRLTTPEDIANVVYLLTTKEAEWITGTVIKVDGGESLQ